MTDMRDAFGRTFGTTELSSWLRTAAAAGYRTAVRVGGDTLAQGGTVAVPIGPAQADPETEDRTCDRCRTYVPPAEVFWPFKCEYPALAGHVIVFGGLCTACRDKELP
jgi:hypothetical protein